MVVAILEVTRAGLLLRNVDHAWAAGTMAANAALARTEAMEAARALVLVARAMAFRAAASVEVAVALSCCADWRS